VAMKVSSAFSGVLFVLCALLVAASAPAQTKPQKPAAEPDDVIRVNTELVQTDMMVFDKDGHFVDGLKVDQFQLKINGKPTPVSFFEGVTSGRPPNDEAASSTSSAKAPGR